MSYPNLVTGMADLFLRSDREGPSSSNSATAALTPPLTSAQPVQASLKGQVPEKKVGLEGSRDPP